MELRVRWASRMEVEPEEGASTLVEFFLEPDAREAADPRRDRC